MSSKYKLSVELPNSYRAKLDKLAKSKSKVSVIKNAIDVMSQQKTPTYFPAGISIYDKILARLRYERFSDDQLDRIMSILLENRV